MRKFSKKQYLVAGAAAIIVAAGTGTAYAYWTSTGTGTGTATTGTSSPFTVDLTDVNLADLTPGGPSDAVSFTVTNPGSGAQYLHGAVASVTGTSAGANCAASNFTTSDLAITAGTLNHGESASGTFNVQMIDTHVDQDACQGVTVDLQVDVS